MLTWSEEPENSCHDFTVTSQLVKQRTTFNAVFLIGFLTTRGFVTLCLECFFYIFFFFLSNLKVFQISKKKIIKKLFLV